jgi:Ser-tRNA(Ala) deacylase AlaX
MEQTKLLYLEDFNTLEFTATVVSVEKDDQFEWIVLDQTYFYPQGGGQPFDLGTLESESGKFIITQVRFVDGVVRHIGSFGKGTFKVGGEVTGKIDQERRTLNSKLHSAGHLVDMAVRKAELGWVPGKGYHFPEGPYVEYQGDLEGKDIEKLKADLEKVGDELIQEGKETKIVFADKDEMR